MSAAPERTSNDKSRSAQQRRNWKSRLVALKVDHRNRRQYGPDAPRFAELLWIPLDRPKRLLKHWSSWDSGRVVGGWPLEKIRLIHERPSIRYCLQHWRDGMSWEETGIYGYMLDAIRERGKVDGLRNRADVEQRYRELDRMFLQARAAGGLSPRREFVPGNFREEGGVLFHIGPGGEPFFAGRGHHRLAMALALNQAYMPAQLGCVHKDGLRFLPGFRARPGAGSQT